MRNEENINTFLVAKVSFGDMKTNGLQKTFTALISSSNNHCI